MPLSLPLVPLAGFTGIMMTAAVEDCRRFIIPNTLVLALVLLWPAELLASWPVAPLSALSSLGCALAVFVVGAGLFAKGYIGGGDVKLLAAATLWAGPQGTPELIIMTALFGGAISLFLLSPLGALASQLRGLVSGAGEAALPRNAVPYGLAVSAAALLVVVPAHFGS